MAQRSGHRGLGHPRLRDRRRRSRSDPAGVRAADRCQRDGCRKRLDVAQGDRGLPPAQQYLMGVMYRLMYAVGFAPWDRQMPAELKAVIEGPDALPPARALDLGSGLGTKAIYMAAQVWEGTGVWPVPPASPESPRLHNATRV